MYRANTHTSGDNYANNDSVNSHTRISYKGNNSGYFQRVGSSIVGVGIGFLILFGSFPLLFWNEGRAVQTAKSLDEGLRSVIKLSSIETPLGENENKLVHLSGKLDTKKRFLSDYEFAIQIPATHLRRHVEMYQWVEKQHKREYKEGDRTRVETTYSYHREWKSDIIKSDAFSDPTSHENPSHFAISKETQTANHVYVGGFQLSQNLKSSINDFKTYFPRKMPDLRDDLILLEQYFYHRALRSNRIVNPYNPTVGDLRVSFSYAGLTDTTKLGNPLQVSAVARQNGFSLSAYKTAAGNALELLYLGNLSAEEIFEAEHSANTFLTWGLRFAGWVMMFIAFQIIMDIFRQIVSFLPIIRDIVGLATSLLAFTFATSTCLVIIAVGWFYYRPFLSFALILSAAVPLYFSRQKAKKQKEMEE